MKFLQSLFLLAILLGCCDATWAQATTDPSAVIKQLLAVPAPTPRRTDVALEEKKQRPPNFYDNTNVPPDDAPIEDLLEYWTRWAYGPNRPAPSDTVRLRLLDAYVDDVSKLAFLLPLFPSSEKFAEGIKQSFDRAPANNAEAEEHRQEIKKWLVFNSKYFVDELFSRASRINANGDTGLVENEEALVALAKFDWARAEPLLETLVNRGEQRASTIALALSYQHSIDEKEAGAELKFRSQLQAIASNRSFPGRARNDAIEALSITEWSGKDEWYLLLFSDASLFELRDDLSAYSPLSTLFAREPDKWIPVMTKLVAGKDRTVQQTAASCLARYAIDHPRHDTIVPLLRWLTEPDWIPNSSTERAWFIQKLDQVDVSESIPGLIWIVESDEEHRRWAAGALAHYKDARAVPALKRALAEVTEDDRPFILEGLLASGGLTESEQVQALEAYATMLPTQSDRDDVEMRQRPDGEPLPIAVSTGRYLAKLHSPPDTLARAVLNRAASVRTKNLPLSRALLDIAHRWEGRLIDLDLIDRIASNTAEANLIIAVLNRRISLREHVKPELQLLIATSSVPKGIGAIVLDDNDLATSILGARDQWAQIGLLAAARILQTPLSIDLVRPLLKSKNALLAMAAERYLLAEDSKEARTLLWQHHPQQAFITGWRENIQLIAGSNFDNVGKQEEKLRAELLKPGGPVEIFALLTNFQHRLHVLRIYADKSVYTYYEDASRYRERVVTKDELVSFRQSISTNGITDLGPQFQSCHHECSVSEFVVLSRAAGRRVFSHSRAGTLEAIFENLAQPGAGATVRTRYSFEKEIKGLEVLYADKSLPVLDVWQHDDEIRILVEREETEEEREERSKSYSPNEDDNERAERWQHEYFQFKTRVSWRKLTDKDASSLATTPDGYATFDDTRFPFDEVDSSARRAERQIQVLTADSILFARNLDGLWKQVAGRKAVRISGESGAYANPIVTPDGKWAVMAKADSNWKVPHYLVRLNLETGQESRVNLEPAEDLVPIVFLPQHGKVLLRRTSDYYLFEPQTGAVQSISGEFEPLLQEGKRFLQPAAEPNQYWAAIADETEEKTVVGRYNLKDFSFKPVLTVPQISFDSMSMWVDEKQQKLYLVYKGELLRLPLQSAP